MVLSTANIVHNAPADSHHDVSSPLSDCIVVLQEVFVLSWVFHLVVLGHSVCSTSRFPQKQVLVLPAEDVFIIDGR